MSTSDRRSRSRRIPALVLGAFILCGAAGQAAAQVRTWRLGQGGDTWESQAERQVGAVSVEGALQPLQIEPGRNLVRLLATFGQQWASGQPEDFVEGGQPHTWSNSAYFNSLPYTVVAPVLPNGPLVLVDGDSLTSSGSAFKSSGNPQGTAFFWDLGAAFPINRLRFYPHPESRDDYLRAFEVFTSSGTAYDRSKRPVYSSLRRLESNREAVVEIDFAPLNSRFIQLRNLSRSAFDLAELEVYGEGFVPSASYVSALHTFDRPTNFGRLVMDVTRLGESAAREDPPVVSLQMRSGADDTPLNYYRRDRETGREEEVSQNEYEKQLPRLAFFRVDPVGGQVVAEVSRSDYLVLPADEQGPVRDYVAGSIRTDARNWSPWSTPIRRDSTGTYELSPDLPSPRRYLQFRVFFEGGVEDAMRLGSLRLEYSPLLATAAVGEVALAADLAPADGITAVPPGVDTTFIYAIRAEFAEDGLEGFSGIEVAASPAPVFVRLEIGEPLAPVEVQALDTTQTGFRVHFAPVTRASVEPIRVTFRQAALAHNTPVSAWLLGARGGLPQPVAAGDASNEVSTNALSIFTEDPESALHSSVSTRALTPNGDGVHDVAVVSYSLVQFSGEVGVEIGVFDLAGRRVSQLVSARRASGEYTVEWDGRGEGGDMVPPGNYVCRIEADSEARTFTKAVVLGVAY
ncbi:MAG: FlgD immunoglobulin-like domain containing protein [Candidatus Latescibacterota bacterium]